MISDITVNGTSVSHISGIEFPIINGDNGAFVTTELGSSETMIVYYSASISGQSIILSDSSTTSTCHQVTGNGSDTFTVTTADVSSNGDINITTSEGSCN